MRATTDESIESLPDWEVLLGVAARRQGIWAPWDSWPAVEAQCGRLSVAMADAVGHGVAGSTDLGGDR